MAAWWRLEVVGENDAAVEVISAAVTSGPAGTFLWLAVLREGSNVLEVNGSDVRLEKIQLSEPDTLIALDARGTFTVEAGGLVTGLTRFLGTSVRVAASGMLLPEVYEVASDRIAVDVGLVPVGTQVTVGYLAKGKARLLPKNVKGGKVRSTKIGLILNDSTLPLINGKRPPDRHPSTELDAPEPRTTGKVDLVNLGWDTEGVITIEQDIPFRTEILALYEATQVNEA